MCSWLPIVKCGENKNATKDFTSWAYHVNDGFRWTQWFVLCRGRFIKRIVSPLNHNSPLLFFFFIIFPGDVEINVRSFENKKNSANSMLVLLWLHQFYQELKVKKGSSSTIQIFKIIFFCICAFVLIIRTFHLEFIKLVNSISRFSLAQIFGKFRRRNRTGQCSI